MWPNRQLHAMAERSGGGVPNLLRICRRGGCHVQHTWRHAAPLHGMHGAGSSLLLWPGVHIHASNFVRPGARRPLRRGGLRWRAVRRFVRRQTDPGVAWSTPGSPQGVAAPCQAPCSGTTHLPRALLAALPIRSCIAGCTEQRACSATGRSESRRSSMLSCLRISRLALAGQCITYSSL